MSNAWKVVYGSALTRAGSGGSQTVGRTRRALRQAAHEPAPRAVRLEARHALLEHERRERLEHGAGRAQPKARVLSMQLADQPVGSKGRRVVTQPAQAGRELERRGRDPAPRRRRGSSRPPPAPGAAWRRPRSSASPSTTRRPRRDTWDRAVRGAAATASARDRWRCRVGARSSGRAARTYDRRDRPLARQPVSPSRRMPACTLRTRLPRRTSPSSGTARPRRSRTSGPTASQRTTASASCSHSPMDACGCSNLICGTNTLFYDDLRERVGVGNFFRYADTFLFGVGCEPGDFNQLDVWPLHKFVTVLSPTAEALIETINDRRITLLAMPGDRRALPRRGHPVDLERVLRDRALRRDVLAAHRPRARRRRGARRQPGRRELRRAGDLLDAGHRRRRAGAAPPPPPQPRSRAEHLRRGVPHAAQPGRRAGAARRHRGAAARPSGDQPARHADRDRAGRRAAAAARCGLRPDRERRDVRVRREPPRRCRSRPTRSTTRRSTRSSGAWAARSPSGRAGTGSPTSATPIAEHHAVREAVGIWDESPLRKWRVRRARRPRRGRSLLHQRHGRARDRPGALRRVLRRARQDARRRHGLPRRGRRRARRDRAPDRRRRTSAGHPRPRRRDQRGHGRAAPPADPGAALARAARRAVRGRRRRAALLPLLPPPRARRRLRRVLGVADRVLRASSATRSTAARSTPSRSGRRCSTRAPRSGSGRTASRRSSRCASRPG